MSSFATARTSPFYGNGRTGSSNDLSLHSDLSGIFVPGPNSLGPAAAAAENGLYDQNPFYSLPPVNTFRTAATIGRVKPQEGNFVLSAIFCAIEEDNLEGLQTLLSMAAIDINQTNAHGESAIHIAAGFGRLDILQILHEKGGNLGLVDSQGDSAILWAARQGYPDIIRYLLSKGVHLNQQNKQGETVLHVACRYAQTETVRYLTGLHVNVDAQDKNLDTALHIACWQGSARIVQVLLKAGAGSSSRLLKNEDGETALHVASSRGNLDCVRCLIANGGGENSKLGLDDPDKWGNTALHLAIRRRYSQVAMLLLHAGAEFDLRNCSGDTPLHFASREGLLSVAQSLCAFGCSVDLSNNEGQQPIHLAAKSGHTEIVRCLCLAGSKCDVKNSDGCTPEAVAMASGHADVCQLIDRLKKDSRCDEYIDQLIPSNAPISKIKLKVFGDSSVGKTSLIESIKSGYFSGLFRRSSSRSSAKKSTANKPKVSSTSTATQKKDAKTTATTEWQRQLKSQQVKGRIDGGEHALGGCPSSPSSSVKSPSSPAPSDAVHEQYTKGIAVHQCQLGTVGEMSLWEFSGSSNYHVLYDHFIGNVNCVHVVLFSLGDSRREQERQVDYWMTFLRSRIPPVEPLQDCGKSKRPAKVMLVGTHADLASDVKKSPNGESTSPASEHVLDYVQKNYGYLFDVHPRVFAMDANAAGSADMKALKAALTQIKTNIVEEPVPRATAIKRPGGDGKNKKKQSLPRSTKFLELILSSLPDWRKQATDYPVIPWKQFMNNVRENVNPLAADDHLKEVIQQLQLMGEVVYLKGELSDLIVLDPGWLTQSVCGELLSADFFERSTRLVGNSGGGGGSYSLNEFQLASPDWDAIDLLPLLESLGLCTQCQHDGEIRYEFPGYNILEAPPKIWRPVQGEDYAYGGVLLKSSPDLMRMIFPRVQSFLRKHVNRKTSPEARLAQFMAASVHAADAELEAMVQIERGGSDISVQVRGPRRRSRDCFFLLEEVLGVIDHVLLDMSPGLAVDKHVLSSSDLRQHRDADAVHVYAPAVVVKAMHAGGGFDAVLRNPKSRKQETLKDLLCFGSDDICSMLKPGTALHISEMSTLTRQTLSRLLDPQDRLGKDWCLLAVRMGLTDKVPKLEGGKRARAGQSQTAKLFDEWEKRGKASSIGDLLARLEDIGRDDAVSALVSGCPMYRIDEDEIAGPAVPSETVETEAR